MKEVTAKERKQFFVFWEKQRQAVENRLSEKTLRWFNIYTARDNVGYDFGQLRPGKLGQWDLYGWLTDPEIHCDENEAIIASGLTAAEVAGEKRREQFRDEGLDPDNPSDVRMFERLESMSPEQLDAKIERLENQLAKREPAQT